MHRESKETHASVAGDSEPEVLKVVQQIRKEGRIASVTDLERIGGATIMDIVEEKVGYRPANSIAREGQMMIAAVEQELRYGSYFTRRFK